MQKKILNRYKYPLILMREMVRSDFKVKYQDSVLGYFWSVLRPMFLFAILYAVFAVGLRVGNEIENWPVALMAGIVMWQFFSDVTKSGLKTIVSHGNLLRKINFPRYTIVISGTVSAFVSLMINFVLVAMFAVINGVPLLSTLPLVILVVVEIFIFSLGLAFFLGAVYVKYRDIEHAWEILLRGGFYVSAIIYPISVLTERGDMGILMSKIILMNPIAQGIQDVRHLAINPSIPSLWTINGASVAIYLIPITISIIAFVLGAWYFRRKSPYFAEEF